jgi:hypothetical protein
VREITGKVLSTFGKKENLTFMLKYRWNNDSSKLLKINYLDSYYQDEFQESIGKYVL